MTISRAFMSSRVNFSAVRAPQFTAVSASPAILPATAPAAPATMIRAANVSYVADISAMRYIDPAFAKNIVALRPPTDGTPRDQITVPISPQAEVVEGLLYEDPKDPNKKFYLPQYRLVQQQVGVSVQYQISFAQDTQGWVFTMHLERFPPAALGAAAATAQELPHKLSVIFRHAMLIGGQAGGQTELVFQEISSEGPLTRAALRVQTLAERDALYLAMTDGKYNATVTIRRAITVAAPIPAAPAPTPRPDPTFPRDPVRDPLRDPRPVHPFLLDRTATLSMMRMSSLSGANAAMVINPQDMAAVPQFRQVDRALDQSLEPAPFIFPPALHGYIFGTINVAPTENLNLVNKQLQWNGRFHSYYQDPSRPFQFYFLPDSFKIARRPDMPHLPMMATQVSAGGDTPDSVQIKLDYVAVPAVDAARIRAAIPQLAALIVDPLPTGVSGPVLLPLLVDPGKLKFRLALPQANGAAGPFADRPGVAIDLRSGISDSVTLPVTQFQSVFDAMMGGASVLFSGSVSIDLPGATGEAIPFIAKFDNLAGDVLDFQESPDANGVTHTIVTNGIESPVLVSRLGASYVSGNQVIAAQFDGVDLSAPVTLKPGETLSFTVTPTTPLPPSPDDAPFRIAFDLSQVKAVPDNDAIWDAILDPTTPAMFMRTITVQAFPETFVANGTVSAAAFQQVDFEGGASAQLDKDHLIKTVQLARPISDLVLRKADQGAYRYKVRFIRPQGQTGDSDWRTSTDSLLYVFSE